ncbi:hypothetical protein AB0F93_28390 [Micromonospora tulbaghiae]|uniref:hypothetical protein n=1 Tax=Micromonospora tulbaghiae TaxID=479978 RepID=UPI00331C6CF4
MTGTSWEQLPDAAREAVEDLVGPVVKAEPVRGGLNHALAVIVHTDVDEVFVKGLPAGDRRAVRQEREAAVSRLVADVAPRVRWHLPDVAGWNLLGADAIARARHADLRPGSPDLPEVTWRVAWELGRRRPGRGVVDERIERRWAKYGTVEDLALLAGEQVLHTDLRPDNLIVGGDGRVWLVDWAWPALGAAWLDPAIVALWMIVHGHTVEDAQEWFRAGPAGQRASAAAVSAFCRVAARQWAVIADQDPAPWKRQLADAAAAWRAHRRA